MEKDTGINNKISLYGQIASPCAFSHDVFGEGFYTFNIQVSRLSDASDILPCTISERIIDMENFVVGRNIAISGQIRSYNSYIEEENRNRLVLTVFARDYELDPTSTSSPNDVQLDGFICKPPIYRTTPFGREIGDLLLAVNRSYNKSDYIPCIVWGRNARFGSKLVVGDRIKLWGRMQSRIYQKKSDDGEVTEKTAYEVSVSKLEMSADK
ncbi:MAG: single-stranded DNA-binding protein [Defluviitaleaceae bacterium]|nr:single-stranded DNA-binding protein [Defluviitaleaceae bacterium]